MKKEIADKWVEALRSGEYNQGRGYLRVENEYCCLGVLCEILDVPKVKENDEKYIYDGRGDVLPVSVVNLVGIYGNDGSIPGFIFIVDEELLLKEDIPKGFNEFDFTRYDSLAEANDDGVSFNQIANFIERYWNKM